MSFFDLSVFASAGPNIASETSPDEDRLFKSNVAETHSDFILQFFITSLDFNSQLCVPADLGRLGGMLSYLDAVPEPLLRPILSSFRSPFLDLTVC